MFDNSSNETLVLLTLSGSNGAYEALVKRHEQAVYASALSVTHAHHMAEDAAQDAFVSAWIKLNTLSEPSKFGSWVCQIARNCAKNILLRFHAFLPLETAEWNSAEVSCEPEEQLIASESNKELRKAVEKLPERVRKVIELHYFSDLPIAMIAEKMGITTGTVKSQLFEGRRQLRKELSAMNENIDDTLTEKVMKRVEELKLWRLRDDKTGFEKVYEEVLSEVDNLPESEKKHRAMADVLLCGYWWLPGKANDELFARIKDSALLGGNDEAMIYILTKEDQKFYGQERIAFIRDVQIPMLEKAGLSGALAHEWYWLADGYFDENEVEKAKEAFLAAEKAGNKGDLYKYFAPAGLRLREKKSAKYKDEQNGRFSVNAELCETRFIDGQLRRFGDGIEDGQGYFNDIIPLGQLWYRASQSDGRFYDEALAVGQMSPGSNGMVLRRLEDEAVVTPAGVFENCRCFETAGEDSAETYTVWYKEGVGLVKLARRVLGMTDAVVLSSFDVVGGKGLLPIAQGNRWTYVGERDEYVEYRWESEVVYLDGDKAFILTEEEAHRKKHDENSFADMLSKIAYEYYKVIDNVDWRIVDISHTIERAEKLAVTPLQKAYIKAAASVARRIMETDGEFNPARKASGHWNFFGYRRVYKKNGKISSTDYDGRYCFEWKTVDSGEEVLLFNDIYGILKDCAGCHWNDDWIDGFSAETANIWYRGATINTTCSVCDGGRIETEAGVFEKTVKVTLDTAGFEDGWSYRGGKKEYWFAYGIGIVRAVFYLDDARKVTFDLSAYTGTGADYFPYVDGMRRFYRATDLTDGFVASADYTYVEDDGKIIVFGNRCGIREFGPKITQYRYIDAEQELKRLSDENKWEEALQQGEINNFRLFAHLICHDVGNLHGHEDKASAWGKEKLKIIESLVYNDQIPPAWLGMYARLTFYASCPTLGMRKLDGRSLDEGFDMLFRAFDLYEEWLRIPDGAELDTGDPMIFGGIKLYKGKNYMKLPNGSFVPLDYPDSFTLDPEIPYFGLTAKRGWEWFNPAREDPRFKMAIERAKALKEKNK